MKYTLYTVWIAVLLLGVLPSASAQTATTPQNLEVLNVSTQRSGNSLRVDFDLRLTDFRLSPSYELTLTPVLTGLAGNQVELAEVYVEGVRRAKLNKRLASLNKAREQSPDAVTVSADGRTINETVHYSYTMPYEVWMRKSSLSVLVDECGCGKSNAESMEDLAEIRLHNEDFKGELAYILPPKEEPKDRVESGSAYVLFDVARSTVRPEVGNNRAELSKIKERIDFVEDEEAVKINKILIEAFASPEGSFSSNIRLSDNRAAALKNYIQSTYNISPSVLQSQGKGEDWDGLVELIKKDNTLAEKDEILALISETADADVREAKIRGIAGGAPYKQMFKDYYPQLRRSDFHIEYVVPAFTVEKGKQVMEKHPEMLSLEEMYYIAHSYEKGSNEFNHLFDLAIQYFPNDRIANLNAAAAAIAKNDLATAERILNSYTSDKDAWNNIGVLKARQGKWDEAEAYLKRAAEAGSLEAKQNIAEL